MFKYFFSPTILCILLSTTVSSQSQRPAEVCSSTPAAGITVSSRPIACSSDSIRLAVTNASILEELTYQWQSSIDSISWTDIINATSSTCTTVQDTTRFYRRITSCSENHAFSVPVKVISWPCYCKPPASTCNGGDYIKTVYIGNLIITSLCSSGGYTDYSDSIAIVNFQPPGLSIGILLGPGNGNTEYAAIWIDFDHNGVFDPIEYYYIGATTSTPGANSYFGRTINLPLTSPGITKMRVRVRANSNLANTDGCTSSGTGETEDYLVNILPYNYCSGMPLQDTAYANVAHTCGSDSVYLYTTSQNSGYNNFTYQWQKSTDSINWQNTFSTSAVGFDYITNTTYFRRQISCGDSSNYSVPVKVAKLCYCRPAASNCNAGVVINKVLMNGIEYTSDCGYNGYTDFGRGTSSSHVDTILAGTDLPISVRAGCAGANPQHVGVWIDLNLNGEFEESEFTSLGTACGNTVSGNINIPASANGQPKIRVRITTDSSFNASSSCSTFAYGETEDYRINIIPVQATPCPINTWTGFGGDDHWENVANWSCNQAPGENSVVIINSGTVTINSNVTIYSLLVNTSATVIVTPPYNLTILH